MKNVIKTLFVAIVAMSVTFSYAQDKKKPAPKKEKTEKKMEKKDDTKMEKKEAKKPAKKHAAKKKKPATNPK